MVQVYFFQIMLYISRNGSYYGANVALENTYEQSECTTRAPNGVFATVHTSKKGYAILQMLQKYFKFA